MNLTQWIAQEVNAYISSAKRLTKGVLRCLLRKQGYSWRRVRKSLKREQDGVMFDFFKEEIKELLACEQRGELCVWFYDEAGFDLNPHSMYAWLPKEKTGIKAAHLPAKRGNLLTVAGFLRHNNDLEAFSHTGNMNEHIFCAYVDAFLTTDKIDLTRPNIIIIDNASFHKTKLVQEKMKQWKMNNLFFQFIPPYCPELNHIEILWRNIKHQWLQLQNFASKDDLTLAIIEILQQFNLKYSITFD